jgi:hypothetical protein
MLVELCADSSAVIGGLGQGFHLLAADFTPKVEVCDPPLRAGVCVIVEGVSAGPFEVPGSSLN